MKITELVEEDSIILADPISHILHVGRSGRSGVVGASSASKRPDLPGPSPQRFNVSSCAAQLTCESGWHLEKLLIFSQHHEKIEQRMVCVLTVGDYENPSTSLRSSACYVVD